MGCIFSSTEAAQTHHVLHHFPIVSAANAIARSPPHPQRVVGRVVAQKPDKLLVAPSSGRRCLYWKLIVWEEFWPMEQGDQVGSTSWRVCLSKEKYIDFNLVEGTSTCHINHEHLMHNDIIFRIDGAKFNKARNTTEIPENVMALKDDNPNHTWGQTFTYAGDVQTSVIQTGHYKFVEALIKENDVITSLCYVDEDNHGEVELSTFPKDSVYQLGTKGWTRKDRIWWDNLFLKCDDRMVISNRSVDTDGVKVATNVDLRCTFCTLTNSDPKIIGLPNKFHAPGCSLHRSSTKINPTKQLSVELIATGKKRRQSTTVKCTKGHSLSYESRGGKCTWCMMGIKTIYHCDNAECNLHMCMDCYDLTRDAEHHEASKNVNKNENGNGENKIAGPCLDVDKLESMVALAPVLFKQGRLVAAEDFYRRAYEGYHALEGEESLDMLLAADGLADVLEKEKKMKEAEKLRRIVLSGMEEMLGKKSQNTLKVMDSLASLLYEEGKLEEAETLFKTVIQLEAEVLGESHPGTLKAIENLAVVYEKEGKIQEAIPVERRLLKVRQHNMGLTHPKTKESRDKLIELLKKDGQEKEAAKVLKDLDVALHAISPEIGAASSPQYDADGLYALAEAELDDD